MTAYDVEVTSAGGTSGDAIRVEADSEATASAAALLRVPEGWVVSRVSDATEHGPAWGIDTTTNEVPPGPVIGETEPAPPSIDEPPAPE